METTLSLAKRTEDGVLEISHAQVKELDQVLYRVKKNVFYKKVHTIS